MKITWKNNGKLQKNIPGGTSKYIHGTFLDPELYKL